MEKNSSQSNNGSTPQESNILPAAGDLDKILQAAVSPKGELTPQQQDALEGVIEKIASKQPGIVAQAVIRQEMFSGPIPHPQILNGYDEKTRAQILEMAAKEQTHTHEMRKAGLSGEIKKDRRGQTFGLVIAVTGLLTAGWVAQYSTVAASIIGSLDLVAMVAIFAAPRAFEMMMAARAQKAQEEQRTPPKKPAAKPKRK